MVSVRKVVVVLLTVVVEVGDVGRGDVGWGQTGGDGRLSFGNGGYDGNGGGGGGRGIVRDNDLGHDFGGSVVR